MGALRGRRKFYIIGCQRSGTTLMRLILESHDAIQCLDESSAYAVIGGRFDAPQSEKPLLGLKVPCITEQFDDRSWCDPFLLPPMDNPYKGEPVLFMVRDVRDTVASMLALRVDGRRWCDSHLPVYLNTKTVRSRSFRRRYARELSSLGIHAHHAHMDAAFYWRYKADAYDDYKKRGWPVLAVAYEDVVCEPERTLRGICAFLGVEWHSDLLRHEHCAHPETDANGIAIGGTDSKRHIDATSVARWMSELTARQVDEIVSVSMRS